MRSGVVGVPPEGEEGKVGPEARRIGEGAHSLGDAPSVARHESLCQSVGGQLGLGLFIACGYISPVAGRWWVQSHEVCKVSGL